MQVSTAQISSSCTNSTPPGDSLPPAADTPVDISPLAPAPSPSPDPSPALIIPPNPGPSPYTLGPSLWRSTHSNFGTWNNTRYQDEVFYSSILDPSLSYQDEIITYHASIETNFQTGILNGTNPREYSASHKNYPDNPYWNEAMHGNEYEYYISAMNKYIAQLVKQKTW